MNQNDIEDLHNKIKEINKKHGIFEVSRANPPETKEKDPVVELLEQILKELQKTNEKSIKKKPRPRTFRG